MFIIPLIGEAGIIASRVEGAPSTILDVVESWSGLINVKPLVYN